MEPNDLIATGLNNTQAQTYLILLKYGSIAPTLLVRELKLTRSNAYKVLDQLAELGLVQRKEVKKKFVYYPDNPLALTNLVAEQRNLAVSREEAAKRVMNSLLASFHQHTDQPDTKVVTGKKAVIAAYFAQVSQNKPIYFVRSPADIATMSFDTMHSIRSEPARHSTQRHGITPDLGNTSSPQSDTRSNLKRTWVQQNDYNAPVEWSASGSTLLIVFFGTEPHAITITSPAITAAFIQLFKLLSKTLQAMPYYHKLPRK